jgi:N-acetylneuraminic acid mutarotase
MRPRIKLSFTVFITLLYLSACTGTLKISGLRSPAAKTTPTEVENKEPTATSTPENTPTPTATPNIYTGSLTLAMSDFSRLTLNRGHAATGSAESLNSYLTSLDSIANSLLFDRAFMSLENTPVVQNANEWSPLQLNHPSIGREGMSMSAVDSKVIIIGGFDSANAYRNDVWAFDTADNSWTRLKADDPGGTEDVNYPKKRQFHSQSTVGTKVIVFGGEDSTGARRNDVWAFETTNNSWTKLKADDPAGTVDVNYPKKRYYHSQSTVGTKVIIFGGEDSSSAYRNDVWAFETTNNSWTRLKADDPAGTVDVDYPKKRNHHSQSTVGTKVVVFGGEAGFMDRCNDVWAFETTDNTWAKLKANNPAGTEDVDYPKKRYQHSQSTVSSKIIILGGWPSGGNLRNDVWAFETTNNTWTKLQADNPGGTEDVDYPEKRYFRAQSSVGTKVLIFGGRNSVSDTRHDVWAFETLDNTWTKLKGDDPGGAVHVDFPIKRHSHSQSTVGTKIIIFGGIGPAAAWGNHNDVWAFETSDNTWTQLKADDPAGTVDVSYPKRRITHSQSTIGTRVIIFGGQDFDSAYRNDVWAFETTDNSWTKLKADDPGGTVDVNYPKKRYGHTQSSVGSKIIIFGGRESPGIYRNDVWAFETADNTWAKLKADDPGGTHARWF